MAEGEQGILSNTEGLRSHPLDCADPRCILPTCVNTKLMLRHSQGCQKANNCPICQKMKSLASKHAESCGDCNCQIPFCREAKLSSFKNQAQIDLGGFLEVVLNKDYPAPLEIPQVRRDAVDVARPHSCPQTASSNLERNSTQRLAISNPTTPSCLEEAFSILSDNLPPIPLSTMVHHPGQFGTTTSFTDPSQSCPDQVKDQSCLNVAINLANFPCRSFMGPSSASLESTLTTTTIATATPPAWENVSATNNSVASEASSPSPPEQGGRNFTHFHMSQNSNDVHRLTEYSNSSHLSSRESEAISQSTPQAKYVSLGDGVQPKDIKTNSTTTQLKARLIHALYGILRVLMQSKSTEEHWTCVRLLTGVLHEIKTANAVIRTPSEK